MKRQLQDDIGKKTMGEAVTQMASRINALKATLRNEYINAQRSLAAAKDSLTEAINQNKDCVDELAKCKTQTAAVTRLLAVYYKNNKRLKEKLQRGHKD